MKRKRPRGSANHDRWLVSYADFITLMFAFFVVLYSTSQADKRKQAAVGEAIDQAFQALGIFRTVDTLPLSARKAPAMEIDPDAALTPSNVAMGDDLLAPSSVQQDLARIQRNLRGLLSNQIGQHVVSLRIGRDGLVISLREAGFYDSGSATPHANSMNTLNEIADALKDTPYDIRVEGHTDNIPIHTTQFDSNWELSAARATRLARFFIEDKQFAPGRLSAAGYAEFHPLTENDSAEGRSQNRRVDIIVLPRISRSTRPEIRMSVQSRAVTVRPASVLSPQVLMHEP
jgi:chemotaxis protein MotB